MINKALRILIADEDREQLRLIERQLNRFGYYRIAPVRTFDELIQLTSNPCEQIDLLILNKFLTSRHGVGSVDFCQMRENIVQTLIYESMPVVFELVLKYQFPSLNASMTGAPNTQMWGDLMNLVDSSSMREV